MRTAITTASAVFILGTIAMHATRSEAETPAAQARRLKHVVMYKFKDDLAPGQVKEVIDTFAALPKKIEGIMAFEHGTNVSPEGKSEGLTHIFVVTFRSDRDRDNYLKHPAHDAYVQVVKDRREKVVVFDYWAD